tara:strand:- start:584 stop:2155 length:1572 start_codon:yes stop_codon:yes gene_type:complete
MSALNENIELEKKVKSILAFFSAGNYEEVILRTKVLLKKYPDLIDLHNILALAYNGINKQKEGIAILEDVILKQPKNIHILNNLGMMHSTLNNFNTSYKFLNKALEIKPDFFQAANNLSILYLKVNKANEAIEVLKKFLNKENLKNYIFNFSLGNAYQQGGDFKNARIYYKNCLEINPNKADADKAISLMTNYKKDDSKHLESMKKKINNKLSNIDSMLLNYSLGKAYEDLGNYSKSLNHLKMANKINDDLSDYKIEDEKKIFNNIKIIFKKNFEKKDRNYISNKKIIFIVGMPRSGTSLVEQILSSNKKIYGAGELPFITNFAENLFFKDKTKLKYQTLEKIEENKFDNLNRSYFEKLNFFNIKENIITDKAPFNFKWIGLIFKIFPNCKIIHCKRDSMDICWSNYKNFFRSLTMGYSNNFNNLANYYNLYLDLMKFWKNKFEDKIYDIEYEKLVHNPEKEIQNLVNYCEVEWSKDYLNFHKNKKTVTTASLAQVRSPMYKSSVRKWEKFGEELNLLKKLIN